MFSNSASDNEDSDEEWFYESFKRYDDLLMYDVQGSILCATFLNSSRLLLATSGGHLHEVMELSIPKKLIAGKDAGLTRDRDFNVITAGYSKTEVKRMLSVESGVVTSESYGVRYYSIPDSSDETDLINLKHTIANDTKGAPLAVSGSNVVFGTTISNIMSFDLGSNSAFQIPLQSSNIGSIYKGTSSDAVSELHYKGENLYFCIMDKGNVLIYEPRQNHFIHNIAPWKSAGGKWTMDVNDEGSFLATFDTKGMLRVFDIRKVSEPCFTSSLQSLKDFEEENFEHLCVQISPRESLVSVSGLNRNIQVFDFKKSEIKETSMFTHDGHRGKDVKSVVTHLWHPLQEKLVLSADNMGQLQAWRFKVT